MLRWRTASGDARTFVPPAGSSRVPPFAGRPVPVVSRLGVRRHRLQRRPPGRQPGRSAGASRRAWRSRSAGCWRAASPSSTPTTTGIDKVAHGSGLGEHYDAELVAADRLVGRRGRRPAAGGGAGGHRRPRPGRGGPAASGILDPEVMAGDRAGQRRGPVPVAARPGRARGRRCSTRRRDAYGHEAWVRQRRPSSMRRAGSAVRSTPTVRAPARRRGHRPARSRSATSTRPTQGDARLVCRHGSLTDDEMLVPLRGHSAESVMREPRRAKTMIGAMGPDRQPAEPGHRGARRAETRPARPGSRGDRRAAGARSCGSAP